VQPFLAFVAELAYQAMRADPELTVKAAASVQWEMDSRYALLEWREAEELKDIPERLEGFGSVLGCSRP
jgi:hypothetical protein